MNRRAIALLASVAMLGGIAAADVESDADQAFRAASQRAVAGDAGAIDAFEALARSQPTTRWTEHAWAEAARLAERAGDLARARHALEQVIAIGQDDQLVRRSKVTLDRLLAATAGGTWDRVAAEHERLITVIGRGGDPRAALVELEALVRANPAYPRVAAVRRSLARGWEEEGDRDRAMGWLRDAAVPDPGQRMHLDLARMLVRDGALDEAARVVNEALTQADADRAALADVLSSIGDAERRGWRRTALWTILGVLSIVAAVSLRRATGSWRAAARRIVRPPIEVLFLIPVAALLIVVAETGNPLVARAVRTIVVAGVAVAWISGALLEAARMRGPVGAARMAVQALLAVTTVALAAYLAIDRDHVLELLLETWRGGHAMQ